MPDIDPTQFPSNSQLSKPQPPQESPPPRKLERITDGQIVKKKKPILDRFAATFLGEDDARSVGDYVVNDILVPGAKDIMYDVVHMAFDRVLAGVQHILFGGTVKPGIFGTRDRIGSRVSYGNFFKNNGHRLEREDPFIQARPNRYDFGEIVIRDRDKAQEVLEEMLDQILEYGVVKVADLYDAVNIPTQHVDFKYGWDDLTNAYVKRIPQGYIIALPRPKEIR